MVSWLRIQHCLCSGLVTAEARVQSLARGNSICHGCGQKIIHHIYTTATHPGQPAVMIESPDSFVYVH